MEAFECWSSNGPFNLRERFGSKDDAICILELCVGDKTESYYFTIVDMSDQLEPGIHSISECSVPGVADLKDVLGFEQPGERDRVYGFHVAKDGYYVRAQIYEPDWDDRLCLRPPHMYVWPKDNILSYLGNDGRMVVSYAPSKPQKSLPVVEGQSLCYILCTKNEG